MISNRTGLAALAWGALVTLAPGVDARVVRATVVSETLVRNRLGESPSRVVQVVLPPDYDTATERRYPVVYLLHAWGAGPESWLGQGYEGLDVSRALKTAVDAGRIAPMILVLPDVRTQFGGSWYVNSATGGAWEDFIADELVAWVDGSYRTVANRTARAIAGQSMGGYGALRIAIDRPDRFGAVLGMSAPNLVDPNPFGEDAIRYAVDLETNRNATAAPLARVLWSKAVAFSPVPGRAPYQAALPWSVVDGNLKTDATVWERWLGSTLIRIAPKRAAELKGLAIRLEVGDKDPLIKESQAFAAALAVADVPHDLVVFDGDHVRGVRARFESGALEFFDRAFHPEAARPEPTPATEPAPGAPGS